MMTIETDHRYPMHRGTRNKASCGTDDSKKARFETTVYARIERAMRYAAWMNSKLARNRADTRMHGRLRRHNGTAMNRMTQASERYRIVALKFPSASAAFATALPTAKKAVIEMMKALRGLISRKRSMPM
jgi:hypothetical protein